MSITKLIPSPLAKPPLSIFRQETPFIGIISFQGRLFLSSYYSPKANANVQTVIYVHNLVLYFICIFLNIVSVCCILLLFILMLVAVQALRGLCYQVMLFDNK